MTLGGVDMVFLIPNGRIIKPLDLPYFFFGESFAKNFILLMIKVTNVCFISLYKHWLQIVQQQTVYVILFIYILS